MKTQTPNPRTTTPQTANHMTAEGKTKAPTDMPALSLQDVFPESVSTTASHQETIRPPAGEAGCSKSNRKKGRNFKREKTKRSQNPEPQEGKNSMHRSGARSNSSCT
jgi:hypothetical protein